MQFLSITATELTNLGRKLFAREANCPLDKPGSWRCHVRIFHGFCGFIVSDTPFEIDVINGLLGERGCPEKAHDSAKCGRFSRLARDEYEHIRILP